MDDFDKRNELIRLKTEKVRQLEQEIDKRRRMPHRWLHKLYTWQKEFIECREKIQVLTAGNQCGKSSTMIKKTIEWALNEELWPVLWPERMASKMPPSQFWYLYPSAQIAQAEFYDKWVPLMPPKSDPEYGWKEVRANGRFIGICFIKNNLYIYFKTYSQNLEHLQAGTAYMVTCFVDGTMVTASTGLKAIETVQTGDMVLTRDGYKAVIATKTRQAPVIKVTFSNGAILEGTEEHKIWTQTRGWVPLGLLTQNDVCVEAPAWKNVRKYSSGKKPRSFFSKAISTLAMWDQKIHDLLITLFVQRHQSNNFIVRFTAPITICLISPLVIISTILTVIHLTIVLEIYSFLQLVSTTPFIRSLNGKSAKLKRLLASNVKLFSPLGRVRTLISDFALNFVAKTPTGIKQRVTSAAKSLCAEEITLQDSSVLRPVQIEVSGKTAKVNCLNVQDSHEYFANGILVHNCDEEILETIVPELQMRVHATNGYIIFGFTATMGQPFWKDIVEERKRWPLAWVRQISLFDCMKYDDGTPTAWTRERIENAISNCTTDAEVKRRIYGKFVKEDGLKFSHFREVRHLRQYKDIPEDWRYYVGIDWGLGVTNTVKADVHPSGIVFMAVNPAYTQAIVARSWRGDKQSLTCQDLVEKYLEMSADIRDKVTRVFYDYSAGDIGTIATRMGLSFEKANKERDAGVNMINSLLKLDRLRIYTHHEKCPLPPDWVEGHKLAEEFMTLPVGNEGRLLNELSDSSRYALIQVPFDWDKMREISKREGSGVLGTAPGDIDPHQAQLINGMWLRAGEEFFKPEQDEDIMKEIEFWSETFQD